MLALQRLSNDMTEHLSNEDNIRGFRGKDVNTVARCISVLYKSASSGSLKAFV